MTKRVWLAIGFSSLLVPSIVEAACGPTAYTSVASGNFNVSTGSVWAPAGGYPGCAPSGDSLQINPGHTIVMTSITAPPNPIGNASQVMADGSLIIQSGTLNFGVGGISPANLTVWSNGTLSIAGTVSFNSTNAGLYVYGNVIMGAGTLANVNTPGLNFFFGSTLDIPDLGTSTMLGSIDSEATIFVNASLNISGTSSSLQQSQLGRTVFRLSQSNLSGASPPQVLGNNIMMQGTIAVDCMNGYAPAHGTSLLLVSVAPGSHFTPDRLAFEQDCAVPWLGVPGASGPSGTTGYGITAAPAQLSLDIPVAPGPTCPTGGVLIETGYDDGSGAGVAGDGVLENGEITDSTYVCSGLLGTTGATGADGMNGATGADGTNGATGANGMNGATGANGSNGSDGANGATGADGMNGANGTNGTNGSDGANGTAGYNALVSVTPLPAGDARCANGGTRVDSGIDDGAKGGTAGDRKLDPGEVTDTQYICNAATPAKGGCNGAQVSIGWALIPALMLARRMRSPHTKRA